LTRLGNFSQTSEFREAMASEFGGAACVYQDFWLGPFGEVHQAAGHHVNVDPETA
jgi:hypothetical protein